MGIKTKVLGHKYSKKVVRRDPVKADWWDKAAEIEDPETGEKQWKLKKDGAIVPAPGPDETGHLFYRNLIQRLTFQPKKRTEYAILNDKGSGDGQWISLDKNELDMAGGGENRMFDTHRNFLSKKTVEIFSKEDNKELYILGALALITMTNLIGMYIIASNADKIGQQAIQQAVKAGVDSAGAASDAADGNVPGTNFIPVFALYGRKQIQAFLERLKP